MKKLFDNINFNEIKANAERKLSQAPWVKRTGEAHSSAHDGHIARLAGSSSLVHDYACIRWPDGWVNVGWCALVAEQ